MNMSKAAVSVIGTLLVLGIAGCTKSHAEPNDVIPDSQQGGIVEAYGLKIRLPKDWVQMPVPTDAFAVAGSCDRGNISLLVEARPFDRVSRTAGLDKEIGSSAVETSIATFAGKKGHGFRRVGRARGGELSYILFFPDAPSESIAILIVQVGRSDSRRTEEVDQIVGSIEIIPPAKKWSQ
jgi:hypothetical protein